MPGWLSTLLNVLMWWLAASFVAVALWVAAIKTFGHKDEDGPERPHR